MSNPACNKWPSTSPFFGGPYPTRTWTRAEGVICNGTAESRAQERKSEVLQYKDNSAHLTKKQKWAQLATGKSHNKKQSWATQSQTYTDFNVNNLYKNNNTLQCEQVETTIDIVGYVNNGSFYIPAYWNLLSSEPQLINVTSYSTVNVFATDINNNKNVIGYYSVPSPFNVVPLYWISITDNPTPLNVGIYNNVVPISINNNGEIVGNTVEFSGTEIAIFWSSYSDNPVALPLSIYIGNNSYARGINNKGEIVGNGTNCGLSIPFYWTSQLSNPITLSIGAFSGNYVIANGINNKDEIVGYTSNGVLSIPLYWASQLANPVTLSLGTFSGKSAFTNDINDDGVIIGYYCDGGFSKGIYWDSVDTIQPKLINSGLYSGNVNALNGIKL